MVGPLLVVFSELVVVGPLLTVFSEPVVVGPLLIVGLEQVPDNSPEAVSLTMYISSFPAPELSPEYPAMA